MSGSPVQTAVCLPKQRRNRKHLSMIPTGLVAEGGTAIDRSSSFGRLSIFCGRLRTYLQMNLNLLVWLHDAPDIKTEETNEKHTI